MRSACAALVLKTARRLSHQLCHDFSIPFFIPFFHTFFHTCLGVFFHTFFHTSFSYLCGRTHGPDGPRVPGSRGQGFPDCRARWDDGPASACVWQDLYKRLYIYTHTYIYRYVCACIAVCIYIYIYIHQFTHGPHWSVHPVSTVHWPKDLLARTLHFGGCSVPRTKGMKFHTSRAHWSFLRLGAGFWGVFSWSVVVGRDFSKPVYVGAAAWCCSYRKLRPEREPLNLALLA